MAGAKAKELAAGRFNTPGLSSDGMRIFSRALELLSSTAAESDVELLDMVKRAKREVDKEPLHVTKKPRTGRGPESSELHALGHRNTVSASADHGTAQQINVASVDGISSGVGTGVANMTQTQSRLINVIRSGPGKGRIEKPKRKVHR